MISYYNENDRYAAAWLRELMKEGVIAPGEVDERDIQKVEPADLKGFTQCHFFAGIGVWSAALRGAGWRDDEPVWTGSCPCQPFSSAGKRLGTDDVRHLWPEWWRLISGAGERRPPVIFGEQVASPDGLAWLDIVQTDLEGAGYAFAPFDLCAAGFGAPHRRQRLYFVAESDCEQAQRGDKGGFRPGSVRGGSTGVVGNPAGPRPKGKVPRLRESDCEIPESTAEQQLDGGGSPGELGNAESPIGGLPIPQRKPRQEGIEFARASEISKLGYNERDGHDRPQGESSEPRSDGQEGRIPDRAGATNGFWGGADWVLCRKGDDSGWEWRPIEPGTFPLANGLPTSMGKMLPETQRLAEVAGLSKQSLKRAKSFRSVSLRGYGNAINKEVAEGFIRAYRETVTDG